MAKELVKKSNDNARTTLDALKGLGKTVDDITKKKGKKFPILHLYESSQSQEKKSGYIASSCM